MKKPAQSCSCCKGTKVDWPLSPARELERPTEQMQRMLPPSAPPLLLLLPHHHLISGRPLSADQHQFPSHPPHSPTFPRLHSRTFRKPHQGTEISLPAHLQPRLPSGENQSQVRNLMKIFIRSPTSQWLHELPSFCESECSVMLQSKSIGPNQLNSTNQDKSFQSIQLRVQVDPNQEIVKIQNLSRRVSQAFAELCR